MNHKRIREIVLRGADQRLLLAKHLRRAQLEGRLKDDLDPEALTRVYLSLLQGFILQQSLDPDVDVGHYLRASLHSIIDSTMPDPETTGIMTLAKEPTEPNSCVVRRRLVISGRVQGVGYRVHGSDVKRGPLVLSVKCSNRDDGCVEEIPAGTS